MHDWAKVRELVRQGVPRQRIAERLGCSRTTVYRLLSLETPPRYERTPAGSLLDPFKDAIVAMLADDATAPATVVREHLRRQGYGGGITILKDYLTEVSQVATPALTISSDMPFDEAAGVCVGSTTAGAALVAKLPILPSGRLARTSTPDVASARAA